MPDALRTSLAGLIAGCVEPGSLVHTDGWNGYSSLERRGTRHRVTVTHGSGEVAGTAFRHVHWGMSLLQRWLLATLEGKVGAKHLQLYLDEYASRFNRRRSRHVGKFSCRLLEQLVLQQAATYRELIDRPEHPNYNEMHNQIPTPIQLRSATRAEPQDGREGRGGTATGGVAAVGW